jgi:hypothetical protein
LLAFYQTKSKHLKLLAGASFLLSVLSDGPVHATELAGASLDVRRAAGAEDCPSANELKLQTLALGAPPKESAEPLTVQVDFHRSGAEFVVDVHTTGRAIGTRQVDAAGPTCAPLAKATAVLLGVLLDLRPRESAPVQEMLRAPTPPPPTRSGLLHDVAFGARADVAVGLLGPAFSPALDVVARARLRRFDIGLGGFGLLNRSIELAPGTVDVGLLGGSLVVCGYWARLRALELGACATLLAGSFHGQADGYFTNRERASLWLAGGIGATLALELGPRWALRAGIDAVVPFQSYRPEIDLVGRAYRPSPVGAFVGLGPELRFR